MQTLGPSSVVQVLVKRPDNSWKKLAETPSAMSKWKKKARSCSPKKSPFSRNIMKAYGLDKQAALKSASWGKFQIMGKNHAACGADSIEKFVRTMCSGELGQIQLLAGFIEYTKPLHDALKKKDWAKVAFHYNGKGYKVNKYDTKMRQAYHEIKKKGSSP